MYKAEPEKARKEKRPIAPNLNVLPRKHPLLLESLDQMVQKFLLALRSRGSLINPHLELDHIDLDSSSWAKSLFRRMGFKKRMKTTGKIVEQRKRPNFCIYMILCLWLMTIIFLIV